MLSLFQSAKRRTQDARLQKFFWKMAEASANARPDNRAALKARAIQRASQKANDN